MRIDSNVNLDIHFIKKLCLHRYPLLLIDRIVNIVPGKSATAIKNTTYNESFYQGHFPDLHVMPGILQIEIMAQTSGIPFFIAESKSSKEGYELNKLAYNSRPVVVKIDNVKFKKMVFPGDALIARTVLKTSKMGLIFSSNTLHVLDAVKGTEKLASEAEIVLMVRSES